MKEILDGSVDTILADLPYGTTQNKWDSVLPLDELWTGYRRLARGSAMALTASQPFTSTLVVSNAPRFRHEWIWIKNARSKFANTVREPMKEHESVLVFADAAWTYNKQMRERAPGSKGGVRRVFATKTANYGAVAGSEKNITDDRVPSSWQILEHERGLHPTQKPAHGVPDPHVHERRRDRSSSSRFFAT